ncbi:MAG TPA: glycosyltransferase family 4 protein [Vicinamibacteria bacterium]|nr:glycosyltransferase family 4 protein [Vicinamibacteria bacterium]
MNVLFATGIYPPDIGGPATYVRNLAQALAARGTGVEVVTYGDGARTAEEGFAVHRVRRRALPVRYAAYAAAVRRAAVRADLVFAQDPLSAGLPARVGARLARRPALLKVVGDLAWEIADELGWTEDGVDVFQTRRYGPRVEALRRLQRTVARGARGVIVPSAYLRRMVLDWGVEPERLHVVQNGVPPPAHPLPSAEQARQRLGLAGDFVVTSIGRLIPLKRFDLLIRALAALRGEVPQARLVLVGSGPCESALRALASESGLAERVRFAGRLPHAEVVHHLRASHVFALVSTHEGFSHVLLEAMQAGVPVVATDVGGNREVVEDGRCGRLLEEASPAAVAAALGDLWRSAVLRARLATEGERRARESWPAMLEGTLRAFAHVLADR